MHPSDFSEGTWFVDPLLLLDDAEFWRVTGSVMVVCGS